MSPVHPGAEGEAVTAPRYSREDFADAVKRLTVLAAQPGVMPGIQRRYVSVDIDVLRATAAMMSEAANRAPTHQELLAGQLPREERRVQAAERLCSIYWDIAVAAVGEDEVRRRRDEEIARIIGAGARA